MIELHEFDTVWDAISGSPEESASMRARADLMIDIAEVVKYRGWSQAEVATRCGLTQPRVSDLLRGRITRFSLDALVNIGTALGHHVTVKLGSGKPAPRRKSTTLAA